MSYQQNFLSNFQEYLFLLKKLLANIQVDPKLKYSLKFGDFRIPQTLFFFSQTHIQTQWKTP